MIKKYYILVFLINSLCEAGVYEKIAELHLKTFKLTQPVKATSVEDMGSASLLGSLPMINISISTGNSSSQSKIDVPELTDYDLNKAAFNSLSLADNTFSDVKTSLVKASLVKTSLVIDDSLWRDLNLFCGKDSSLNKNLLSIVDRTSSIWGKVTLAGLLATPVVEKSVLIERQETIKELVDSHEDISSILDEVGKNNVLLASFWSDIDVQHSRFLSKLYLGKPWFPQLDNLYKEMNESPLALEVMTRISQFSSIFSLLMYPFLSWKHNLTENINKEYLSRDGLISTFDDIKKAYPKALKDTITFKREFKLIRKIIESGVSQETVLAGLGEVGLIGYTSYVVYMSLHGKNEFIKAINIIKNRLSAVKVSIKALAKIENIVNNNDKLKFGLTSNLFHSKSESLKRLLTLLSEESFDFDQEVSFFSNLGKILVAYRLIIKHKDDLINVISDIGKVDAYMSIAKLYKEFEDRRVKYSFVVYQGQPYQDQSYQDQSYQDQPYQESCEDQSCEDQSCEDLSYESNGSPYINLHEFWNPFVDYNEVIPSSVELGGKYPRNMLITGPNAGGKSTILRGVMINLLLAQTFGIAAAKNCCITPFSKIKSYLDVSDSVGASLFQAQVLKTLDILNSLDKLGKKEFGFIAVDEIYSGTNPSDGEEASYAVCKALGKKINSISAIATHYNKLTELESKTGLYSNYKVTVEKDDLGNLSYPYILLRGKSNQSTAFDILRIEGVLAKIS